MRPACITTLPSISPLYSTSTPSIVASPISLLSRPNSEGEAQSNNISDSWQSVHATPTSVTEQEDSNTADMSYADAASKGPKQSADEVGGDPLHPLSLLAYS